MKTITLEFALEIRAQLRYQKEAGEFTHEEYNVISGVLAGFYDRMENPLQVARDDIEFTEKYNKGEI